MPFFKNRYPGSGTSRLCGCDFGGLISNIFLILEHRASKVLNFIVTDCQDDAVCRNEEGEWHFIPPVCSCLGGLETRNLPWLYTEQVSVPIWYISSWRTQHWTVNAWIFISVLYESPKLLESFPACDFLKGMLLLLLCLHIFWTWFIVKAVAKAVTNSKVSQAGESSMNFNLLWRNINS